MFRSPSMFKTFRTSALNSSQALVPQYPSEESSEESDSLSNMSEINDFERLISLSLQNGELNFREVSLNRFSCEDIIDGFSDLPLHTHTIHLENAALNLRSGDEVEQIMQSLPRQLSCLNLAGNAFNEFSTDELELIFTAMPPALLTLNLANTTLYKIPTSCFVRIFRHLSPKLQHLNLSDNQLGQIENIEMFAEALKSLPRNLQSIQLDGNMLGLTCKKDNQLIVSALPSTLVTVSLKNNIYKNWKDKDFTQVLSQLPSSVRMVEINHNYLGLRRSLSKEQQVLSELLKKQLVLTELLKIPKSFCLSVGDGDQIQNYDIKAYRQEIYQQARQDIELFLRRKLSKDCRKKLNDFLNLINHMQQNGYDQGQLAIALADTRDFLQEKISYLAYVKRCKTYQGSTDILYKRLGDVMMVLGAAIFAAGLVLTIIPTASVVAGVGTGVGGLTLTLSSYGLFRNTGLAKASEDLAREYLKILKVEP